MGINPRTLGIHLILSFVNPADFVSDLLKKVVSNMRELKVLYSEE
jgi:translation elongation factor EF-Tu-like GTPase